MFRHSVSELIFDVSIERYASSSKDIPSSTSAELHSHPPVKFSTTRANRSLEEEEKRAFLNNSKISKGLTIINRGIVMRPVNTVTLPSGNNIWRQIAVRKEIKMRWSAGCVNICRARTWSFMCIYIIYPAFGIRVRYASTARFAPSCLDALRIRARSARKAAKIMPAGDETFGGRDLSPWNIDWNAS